MSKGYNKKLIAPAIALMMCAVAFIGIGYALTSSVHSGSNTINYDELTIDLDDIFERIKTAQTVSKNETNGLFNGTYEVTNSKPGTADSDGKTYTYNSYTYLKVFDETSYKTSATQNDATLNIKSSVEGLKVVIYETGTGGVKGTGVTGGTIESTTTDYSGSIPIKTNTVYYVAIEDSTSAITAGNSLSFSLTFQVVGN